MNLLLKILAARTRYLLAKTRLKCARTDFTPSSSQARRSRVSIRETYEKNAVIVLISISSAGDEP